MLVKTEVRPSPIHGNGCFAAEFIPEGKTVWCHIERLEKSPIHLCDFCDDARFINHSFDPNTGPSPFGETIALRDIRAGEEITENYWRTVPHLASKEPSASWLLYEQSEEPNAE